MVKRKGSNRLLFLIITGITIGILVGGFYPEAGRQVKFLGEMFMRALLMLVVPLVMVSMIVGVSGLGDIRKLGKLGGRTLAYFMITTMFAAVVGIILVNTIKPGKADTPEERIALRGGQLIPSVSYTIDDRHLTINEKFSRVFDNRYTVYLTDQNIQGQVESIDDETMQSLVIKEWQTEQGKSAVPNSIGSGIKVDLGLSDRIKGKGKSPVDVVKDMLVGFIPRNIFKSMAENEVLPLITISLVFGAVLTTIGRRGRMLITLFRGVDDAIMKMIHLLMLTAPIGIGALIAGRIGDAGGFAGFWPELLRVGKYAFTVLFGIFIFSAIILPTVLHFVAKRNVWKYAKGMLEAFLTAFSTSSSNATIPVTMECCVENNKVSDRVTSFVVPLGATLNMNGTALYEAVAAIFVAQLYGIELMPVQMVVVFLTATLAAIGAAGIPEAGLVTMVMVMMAVHLPVEGISLILVIDWFLDRFRTVINVWDDAIAAAVIDRFELNDARKLAHS